MNKYFLSLLTFLYFSQAGAIKNSNSLRNLDFASFQAMGVNAIQEVNLELFQELIKNNQTSAKLSCHKFNSDILAKIKECKYYLSGFRFRLEEDLEPSKGRAFIKVFFGALFVAFTVVLANAPGQDKTGEKFMLYLCGAGGGLVAGYFAQRQYFGASEEEKQPVKEEIKIFEEKINKLNQMLNLIEKYKSVN